MPNNTHIAMVARRLRTELGSRAFLTVERTHLTEMLRRVSGEPTTRIKRKLAQDLTASLAAQGVHVYPPLDETTTGDVVRLYHAGSIVGQLVGLLTDPSPADDPELGAMVLKIKGKWRFDSGDGQERTIDLRSAKMSRKAYSGTGPEGR